MLLDNKDVVECGSSAVVGLNRLIVVCGESLAECEVCVCECVYEASESVCTCVYTVCLRT